jgi:hypothetical protein
MKNAFMILFVVMAGVLYAQTWTEIENNSGRTRKECTVITKEQYERLVRQYGEDYKCNFIFIDSLDLSPPSSIRGYYYLRLKRHTIVGDVPGLAVGHTSTGRMEIWYGEYFELEVGSPQYNNLYNRYIQRIIGND